MCNERKLFTTLEEMREPKNMIMGNGEVLEVTEKGSVGLRVLTNQGVVEGTFNDVLYAPEISRISDPLIVLVPNTLTQVPN